MFERQKHPDLILSIRLEVSREGSSRFVLALFQDRRKDMQDLSVAQKTAQTARANQASVLPGAPQVIFTHWREALHSSGLARHLQAAYEHGIGRFLEFCTLSGQSVTRP